MFDFFKGGKVQLDLTLDRQVYAPGETGRAHIMLKNDKEINTQGGRFVVVCRQRYQYRRRTRDSDGDTSIQTTWGTHDTEVFHLDFLPEISLPPDTHVFETSFTLPAGGLPSSQGEIVSAGWFAKATLDRKMAADANSQVDFSVPAPRPFAEPAAASEYGVSNEPAEAQMALILKSTAAAGGDTLAGILRIRPQKDFGAGEVRVELERDEYVSDVSGTGYDHRKTVKVAEAKLAGKTQMQTGGYLEFPFSLALPAGMAPSLEFQVASLKYRLKGILARSLRKDTAVEEEIRVFSS